MHMRFRVYAQINYVRFLRMLLCGISHVGLVSMAEKGDSSDEEPTIAEDVIVTKYKMAGDMANRM